MEYRTFIVVVKDDGNLELIEAIQIHEPETAVAVMMTEQTNWDHVIAAGIELHPGFEYGWAVHSRQTRDQLFENIRDEQLGELTGNTPRPSSVDADAVVRERSQGTPDVQS